MNAQQIKEQAQQKLDELDAQWEAQKAEHEALMEQYQQIDLTPKK